MDDSRLLQESYLAARAPHPSYRQLRVKDLPKVPTWQLEVESNQRPSAPKALTISTYNHAPNASAYMAASVRSVQPFGRKAPNPIIEPPRPTYMLFLVHL